jgi:hypothetical protein
MSITKENVIEESKKLGLTLSEDQINAYVLIGQLPIKANTDSATGDKDADTDDKNKDLTAGMQERLRKEKEKQNALRTEYDAAMKKLKEFEDKKALEDAEKDKEKGNWEKLNKDAIDAKAKADAVIAATKDRFKQNAIKARIESELIKAGVPAERLSKALKLFDSSKIEFEWANEETLDFNIEDFGSEIESFKKDNDFLFESKESVPGFQGFKPPNSGNQTSKEKQREEIKRKYPHVF